MDAFARAFLIATDVLEKTDYRKMRKERYASFNGGDGASFEKGNLTLEDMRNLAVALGEPAQISGKQELYEAIINHMI